VYTVGWDYFWLTLSGLIQVLKFPENPEILGNPEIPEIFPARES
jgi:hypothetical protein